MSASLVGSEMCIRDRSSAKLSSYAFGADSRAESDVQRLASKSALCSLTAVSYTHLTLPTI
eukprot:7347947-Alexandrium_andersonii.AAC.1